MSRCTRGQIYCNRRVKIAPSCFVFFLPLCVWAGEHACCLSRWVWMVKARIGSTTPAGAKLNPRRQSAATDSFWRRTRSWESVWRASRASVSSTAQDQVNTNLSTDWTQASLLSFLSFLPSFPVMFSLTLCNRAVSQQHDKNTFHKAKTNILLLIQWFSVRTCLLRRERETQRERYGHSPSSSVAINGLKSDVSL